MAGRKPEAFTKTENAAMRHVLATMKERLGWSQAETGKRLGIGQQAVGTILNRRGGFSLPTAMALAQLAGFESPIAMLRDLGALADPKAAPGGWPDRDLALGHARRLGYPEAAIERVLARFTEQRYASMPPRWWMDAVVFETKALEAELAVPAPPPSASTLPEAPAPKPRTRRKAG